MLKRWMVLGAPVALALAVAVAAGQSRQASAQPGPMGPMEPMGRPLEQLSGDALDQALLREMNMHHAMAVMMAQPVAANAQHQELKNLAQAIIADQTREIAQMRTWLRDWYGVDMPDPLDMMGMMGAMPAGDMDHGATMGGGMMPMPHGQGMPMAGTDDMGTSMMMDMMAQMWDLPPARLEAVFMSTMIVHHEGAIAMAKLAPERAAHQELKDLAVGIIQSQSAEINQMTAWLADWYNL